MNTHSAQASYLYTLFHWIEIAVRARLDCAFAERYGADWHKAETPVYLDARRAGALWLEYTDYQARQSRRSYVMADERPSVLWRLDPVTGKYIPDYASPEDFLAALDFQPLTEMVLHTYRASPPIKLLTAENGQRLHEVAVRDEFRWMRKLVRNSIMHNRADAPDGPLSDLNEFTSTALRMEKILKALGYNLAPALGRHDDKRWVVTDEAVRRMGAKSLQALLIEIAPTRFTRQA